MLWTKEKETGKDLEFGTGLAMVADTSLYDVLQLSPNATEQEIKKACAHLVLSIG